MELLKISSKSYKILKYISKHPNVTVQELICVFKVDVDSLIAHLDSPIRLDYVFFRRNDSDYKLSTLVIEEPGQVYLDSLKFYNFKFWIPVAVSNILALAALIRTFL